MTREEVVSKIKGIFLPILTPYSRRGDIDLTAFRRNLRRYAKEGVNGVIVAGSTGEGPYLTEDERLRLLDVARPIIRSPQLLMAGTGLETTRQTIQLSREAIARGADAVLVLTPAYFKPRMDSGALTTHFRAVADGLPRPLLIYSIPQFTGIQMEAATIARLSRHPNIAGLKESSGNIEFLRDVMRRSRSKFRVLAGSALILLDALEAGAAGAVLGPANYIPGLCAKIYDCYCRGEKESARALQRRIEPMVRDINVRCGVPGVKYAADLCGYTGGMPRAPLAPLTSAERGWVKAALKKARIPLGRRDVV
ncbi:MAG: dihydrodipicolinate synthase family protein [Acidobacteria bacterium]|nr:dihydrodipicolinate synthase family protein [Acidobacteriota bacterium]